MAEIGLLRGGVTLIDEADYHLAAPHRWRVVYLGRKHGKSYKKRPYIATRLPGVDRSTLLHRFLLEALPGQIVDHINGDGLDNRRANLRLCGHIENMQNQHAIKGLIPFKGVSPSGNIANPFRSYLTVSRKRIYLGNFSTAEEAAAAYDSAALKHFGQFARTNHHLGLLSRTTNSEELPRCLPPVRVTET